MVLWSTLTYGIALLPLSSIPLSTLTIGNLKLQVSTLQDQPIKTFLLAPSPSNLGSGFGKLGHLANARLLFGWQFEIAAGQQTGCRKGASLIRSAVLFVTKMVRIYIQHILTSCVFARQFWFGVLQSLNLTHLTPSSSSVSFADWWRRSWKKVQKQHRKGFNSLCILGAWILWKHRNACVFNGMGGWPQICSGLSRLSRRNPFCHG